MEDLFFNFLQETLKNHGLEPSPLFDVPTEGHTELHAGDDRLLAGRERESVMGQ